VSACASITSTRARSRLVSLIDQRIFSHTLSDRIAVIFRGEIMGTFSAADPDAVAEIGPMMAGVLQE